MKNSYDLSYYFISKPSKPDPMSFIMYTTKPVKLTKNDLLDINQTKVKLINIKKKYLELISNPKSVPPEYTLSPIQIFRVKNIVARTFFIYKIFISDINEAQNIISKISIEYLNNLLVLVEKYEQQSQNVKCKFKELQFFFDSNYQKSIIPKRLEKIEKLPKNINFYIQKINSLGTNEAYLIKSIKLQIPKLHKNNDYIEMNNFDELLASYIDTKQNDERLQEIISLIKYGKEQYIGHLANYINKFLKITADEQLIILKSACIRFFYSLAYIKEPEVLNSNANCLIFFNNCNYIASFSPKSLGLSPQLFTVEQMELSLMGVVRHSEILAEMSADLNSLQFLVSPVDMMILISRVILKLEDFVKKNILNKKFGQFASMVESDFNKKKNREMMSFDDCFSLFFSILSINPPSNSIEISVCFQNSPDLIDDMPLKMAKATFVSAVDHILGFSEEQIIKDEISSDPLGIL